MSEDAPLYETSAEFGEIAKVLPAAQAAIAAITKDAANPHFGSRYASLQEIADAIRPAMNAAGIMVLQPASFGPGNVVRVQTVLLHTSAQWVRSTHNVPVSKVDAQGVGSAMTYARRQALASFLLVAPQGEDDDGEGSVGRGAGRPPLQPAEPKPRDRAARVAHFEKTLTEVKTLRDLTKSHDLAKGLRTELAAEEPETAARLDDLYERRHAELIGGAG